MAQFEKHFVQDLTQDIKIRQCGTIVFNGDNLSNVITVDLYNGTEPYSGGGSVSCSVICPDGATVPITNGSISGNTVTVTMTGDCFALPGQIGVGVQVVSGDIRTTVLKAIYNVELLETDTIVDPGSRITASVGQLVSDIENAVAQIPASDMASLMAGIAPTFSASTNYASGAYVYYNGTLYRFTANHSAGSWTGTDATAVALGNDLGGQVRDLKSAFIGAETVLNPIQGYINVDGTAYPNSTSWKHVLARVDNVFIDGAITLTTGSTDAYTTRIPGIIFFDASMSPIAGSAELVGRNAVYKWTTVPDGAVFVCLNTTTTFTVRFRSLYNTLKKENENVITPEMFQAVGNGTSDDADYLQSAINYCITNNLPLKLTPGKTYLITKQIRVNNPGDGFHIYGNGAKIKVSASAELGAYAFALYFNKSSNSGYAKMNYFSDFMLDCSAKCAGIQVDYGYDFTFENITVVDCSTVAINAVDGGECYFNHIAIKCNHNSGNSTALQIQNSDYHFTDVAIIDADRAVYNAGSNMYTRVHAWNTANCAGTYYFVHNAGYPMLVQCHADTYETAYYRETDRPLMLIGCDYYINSNLYDSTNTPVVFKFATSARAYTGQVKCVNCMFDALSTTVNMAEYSHKIQLVNCTKKGIINRYYNGESLTLVSGVTDSGLSVNSNRIWVDNDYQEFDFSLNVSGLTFGSSPVSIGTIQTNIFIPSSFMVFPCMLFDDDYSTSWTPGYISINNSNGIMQVKANTAGTYKKLIANFHIYRPMGVYQG